MPIKQLTVLFGEKNYELNIPVTEQTRYKFIDGHEVLTLVITEQADPELKTAQKEFPWMAESA